MWAAGHRSPASQHHAAPPGPGNLLSCPLQGAPCRRQQPTTITAMPLLAGGTPAQGCSAIKLDGLLVYNVPLRSCTRVPPTLPYAQKKVNVCAGECAQRTPRGGPHAAGRTPAVAPAPLGPDRCRPHPHAHSAQERVVPRWYRKHGRTSGPVMLPHSAALTVHRTARNHRKQQTPDANRLNLLQASHRRSSPSKPLHP